MVLERSDDSSSILSLSSGSTLCNQNNSAAGAAAIREVQKKDMQPAMNRLSANGAVGTLVQQTFNIMKQTWQLGSGESAVQSWDLYSSVVNWYFL